MTCNVQMALICIIGGWAVTFWMIYNLFEKGLRFITLVIAYLSVNKNHSKNRLACELDMHEYIIKSQGVKILLRQKQWQFSVLDSFLRKFYNVSFFFSRLTPVARCLEVSWAAWMTFAWTGLPSRSTPELTATWQNWPIWLRSAHLHNAFFL